MLCNSRSHSHIKRQWFKKMCLNQPHKSKKMYQNQPQKLRNLYLNKPHKSKKLYLNLILKSRSQYQCHTLHQLQQRKVVQESTLAILMVRYSTSSINGSTISTQIITDL